MGGRWLASFRRALLSGVFLLAVPAAWAGPESPSIDVGGMRCAAFVGLAVEDPVQFRALAGWLDGWLSGEEMKVSYAAAAQVEHSARWLEACRAAPETLLLERLRTVK